MIRTPKANDKDGWIRGGKYVKPAAADESRTPPNPTIAGLTFFGNVWKEGGFFRNFHFSSGLDVLRYRLRLLIRFAAYLIRCLIQIFGALLARVVRRLKRGLNTQPAENTLRERVRNRPFDQRMIIETQPSATRVVPEIIKDTSITPEASTAPVALKSTSSAFKFSPSYSANGSQKRTPSTRRVLFSETKHGTVSIQQFSYDKNMPASARKEDRNEKHTVNGNVPETDNTLDSIATSFTPSKTSETRLSQSSNHVAHSKAPTVSQIIPATRLALVPTVPVPPANGADKSIEGENSPRQNLKRKRRELIEAASRMSRRNRARLESKDLHLRSTRMGYHHTMTQITKRERARELDHVDGSLHERINHDDKFAGGGTVIASPRKGVR